MNVDLSAHIGANPTVDITYTILLIRLLMVKIYLMPRLEHVQLLGLISAAATTGTYMTLTVGSLSVTATAHGSSAVANSATNAGVLHGLTALAAAWDAKYGGGGVSLSLC